MSSLARSLLVVWVSTFGCTGVVGGPAGDDSAGDGTRGGNAIDDEQRAIDDELAAENPELFAVASEYFPGLEPAPAKPRLFRLTRSQLDITVRSLLPAHFGTSALASLPRDPLEKNYEYAANLSFSPANFTPYVDWVAAISENVRSAPASVIDCSADDGACLRREAKAFVARAFRGATSEAQLERYADLFSEGALEIGVADATAELVDVALASPSFVFRDEVNTSDDGVLLAAQQLQHVTYTLADAPPQALGLATPALDAPPPSAAELAALVESVLGSPLSRAKLLRFFEAWLEVREPDDFAIANSVYPEFTPEVAAAVVEETRAFLDHQLSKAAPSLKDVTQSTQSFVSEGTAFLYGMEGTPASGLVELDPEQRVGIFTQPAVIASHSGPTTTRLVKRGVFFTRKVMCLPLGVPPEGVDTSVPDDLEGTERQKIESVTTPATCAGCHAYINPFGFMQENYDAIGRFRTEDNGLPVDAGISVDFLDEGNLTTSSPVEALKGFTRSLRFQQCFTRQLFRFYMGRDEAPGDDPVLRQMFFNFANRDEQDIVELLRVLAGSSTFSRRLEAP